MAHPSPWMCSVTGDTSTAVTPASPRYFSHSLATSCQGHSKRETTTGFWPHISQVSDQVSLSPGSWSAATCFVRPLAPQTNTSQRPTYGQKVNVSPPMDFIRLKQLYLPVVLCPKRLSPKRQRLTSAGLPLVSFDMILQLSEGTRPWCVQDRTALKGMGWLTSASSSDQVPTAKATVTTMAKAAGPKRTRRRPHVGVRFSCVTAPMSLWMKGAARTCNAACAMQMGVKLMMVASASSFWFLLMKVARAPPLAMASQIQGDSAAASWESVRRMVP
mmetsp:Transcript_69525/g.207162  ORF Transcript_69525/g.207162 Transcript_69525/m.207162 type:complete len:274 (+) Transcript_69525:1866-2687(+)